MSETTKKTIAQLTVADIETIYDGRAYRCCCGCSGTYFRTSASADKGSREVSDVKVAELLAFIQKRAKRAEIQKGLGEASWLVTVEVRKRWYIAYLVDGIEVTK